VIGEEKPEARASLERIARRIGSRPVFVPDEVRITIIDDGLVWPDGRGARLRLHLETPVRRYRGLAVPLPGVHQARNVAIAVRTAEIILQAGTEHRGGDGPRPPIDEDVIRQGLAATRWPGRLEWVAGTPPLLLDCAHNPAGARALAAALERVGPERVVLVFGSMQDKDFESMARELAGPVRSVICTRPRLERAAPADALLEAIQSARPDLSARAIDHVSDALATARDIAGPEGVVCAAGSIFLIGEIKASLDRGISEDSCQ
jgi:dihydrofolate synthase/folylpolyglutamate synthase